MTHAAALLLALILSSPSLFGSVAAQAFILCPWTKVLSNDLHYSFVWTDSGQPPSSARLYHSSWSGQRMLLGCSWTEDPEVVRSYLSLCWQRPQDFYPPSEKLDLEFMMEAGHCVAFGSGVLVESRGRRDRRSVGGPGEDERSEVRVHPRVKRGFIVPGTLWCGSGNKAPSYADLGVFSNTDSCCREHDQCQHTILSFHSEFGVFNSNIFTMSHCDCDNKFRSCLREANNKISEVVEYTFFNLLKMHCFTLSHRLQCTERNWFGMCKKSQMALYADVHPPEQFDTVCVNSSCINMKSTLSAELLESGASNPELRSTSNPELRSTSATFVVPASSAGSPSRVTKTSERPTERNGELESALPAKPQTVIGQYINTTEDQMSCDVFKKLDECRSKIPPQQRKHGLQNPEARALYHCNCTTRENPDSVIVVVHSPVSAVRGFTTQICTNPAFIQTHSKRFFQTLAEQRRLTKVQTLLLEYVSRSCFLLQNCTAGNTSCTGVIVTAELPELNLSSPAEVEEQRHLQVVKLKVRRPNPTTTRKDRLVKLYRLCQRLTRTKQTKKVTTHDPVTEQAAVRGSNPTE